MDGDRKDTTEFSEATDPGENSGGDADEEENEAGTPRGVDGSGASTSGEAAPVGSAAGRSLPAPFLLKTWDLVNNPDTDDIIGWTPEGKTFSVWKPDEFSRKVLPTTFKHSNFSSFVRQLNIYGFKKVAGQRHEFVHPRFVRGDKDQLGQISRASQVTTAPNPDQSLRTENMWLKQQVYQTWAYYELVMHQLECWGLSRQVLAEKMGVPSLPRYDVSPALVLGKPMAPSGAQPSPAPQEQEQSEQPPQREQPEIPARAPAGHQQLPAVTLNQQGRQPQPTDVDGAAGRRAAPARTAASSEWMAQIRIQWHQQQQKLEEEAGRVMRQAQQLQGHHHVEASARIGLPHAAGLSLPVQQQSLYPAGTLTAVSEALRGPVWPSRQQAFDVDTASPLTSAAPHTMAMSSGSGLGTHGSAFVRPEFLRQQRPVGGHGDVSQPARGAGPDWSSLMAGRRLSDPGTAQDAEGLHRPSKIRRLYGMQLTSGQGNGGAIHAPLPKRYSPPGRRPEVSTEDCSQPPSEKPVLLFGVPLGRKGKV